MPRNSFVQSALEGGRHVAILMWVAVAAWWQAALSVPALQASASGHDRDGPHPLSAFPDLRRLGVHEVWLANPAVRAQRMWVHAGSGDARFEYFILSNGQRRTLGILLRDHELAYMRLYGNYAFAAVDGALWAGEIRDHAVRRIFTAGGVDSTTNHTWSVIVVQRQRRYELQITSGGLIPWTRDFRNRDEALICAEMWITDLQHRYATPEMATDNAPAHAEWVM
jgi:hypothetical protein